MTNQEQQPQETLHDFYARLMKETVRTVLRTVLENNKLPFNPISGAEIKPVPVFEGEHNLLTLVGAKCNTEISWPDIPADTYVPAYFKKYAKPNGEQKSQIVVISENYCQARFFAAKELMHGLIQEDDYPATNSIQLVNELIDQLATSSGRLTTAPQTAVDEIAWLGAALYLIPNGWIPLLAQMVEDVKINAPESSSQAQLHVAREIRVPETVLRLVLQKPYYLDIGAGD